MMLRGLWKLTWIEIKVFMREPLGAIGTIGIPVLLFMVLGRVANLRFGGIPPAANGLPRGDVPVLVALLIAISAVLSLVTIISIYREGGILKRLRATPLRPQTILSAHVIVKLLLTAATLALMFLAGQALLSAGSPCSVVLVHDRAADQHVEHSVGRLCHRQHCPDGPLCAADRSRHSVPDARSLRSVCAT